MFSKNIHLEGVDMRIDGEDVYFTVSPEHTSKMYSHQCADCGYVMPGIGSDTKPNTIRFCCDCHGRGTDNGKTQFFSSWEEAKKVLLKKDRDTRKNTDTEEK